MLEEKQVSVLITESIITHGGEVEWNTSRSFDRVTKKKLVKCGDTLQLNCSPSRQPHRQVYTCYTHTHLIESTLEYRDN